VFASRRRGRRPRRPLGQRGGGLPTGLTLLLMLTAGWLWAYVPVPALAVSLPPASQPPGAMPWLSVSGSRIIDASGRAVLLRGFNTSALLEPETVAPAPLSEQDISEMQRSGFTVLRLPIAWSRLEPVRGVVDAAYLDEVARVVSLAESHGMYVVLDMHFLDWGPAFGGSGAPRWATVSGVPDLQFWPWESWRRHLSPAVNASFTYFWLAPDWQRDFSLVWRAVASRFRSDPGVAGYDLFNEPHPIPIPPRLFEQDWMWPLYARTIADIGAVDPNHLFFVEGDLLGDFPTTIVPLQARGVVYSPHIYTGSLVPPAFDGHRGPLVAHVAEQLGEAGQVPAPMWTGELGIDHSAPHAFGYADAMLDAYDDNQTGWGWWQWREGTPWGVADAAGVVDRAWLAHLARPFVSFAPPGVVGGRGDGVGGTLTVHVAASHGGQDAVVSWPAFTLAAPQVSGACVAASAWDAAAARLTLRLSSGVGCDVSLRAGVAAAAQGGQDG
jgi:endoglycosylceramidase